MSQTTRLIHEKYDEILDRRNKLKKTSYSKRWDDEIKKMEGALEVLLELKESLCKEVKESVKEARSLKETSQKPPKLIVEDDIEVLMIIMYLGREFEKAKNHKVQKEWWRRNAKISSRDYNLILSMSGLLFGTEQSNSSHRQIMTSGYIHAKKLLYNSKDKIDGHPSSYASVRELIRKIEASDSFRMEYCGGKCTEPQVCFTHEDFGAISLSKTVENHKFTITVKGSDGILYKYGILECSEHKFLSYKGYKCTLEEYLGSTTLPQRRKSRFQSTELYPNTYVKAVIQGLLTAMVDIIKRNKKHGFLLHPGNILLHDEVFHPYPESYLSVDVGKLNKKLVLDAYEGRQFTVPISFVNRYSSEQSMDDLDAIYKVIFDKILEAKGNPLPPDWKYFQNFFANKKIPVFYEIISSFTVLWDWQKKLYFLVYACHLHFDSTFDMHYWVHACLKKLDIRQEDWGSVVRGEKPWDKVWHYGREGNPYEDDKVESILKYFRNLVVHVEKKKMQVHNKVYLEHRLSYLFPHLFAQINEELIKLGIKY